MEFKERRSSKGRIQNANSVDLKRNLNKVFENMSNRKLKIKKGQNGLGISYSFKVFNKTKIEGTSDFIMRSVLDTVYGRVSPRKY